MASSLWGLLRCSGAWPGHCWRSPWSGLQVYTAWTSYVWRPRQALAASAQLLWYSFASGFVSCQAGLPRVGADISSGLHTPIRAALAWTLDQAKMRSHLMRPPEMFVEKIPDSAGAAVLAFAPALLAKVWLAEAFLPAGKGKPRNCVECLCSPAAPAGSKVSASWSVTGWAGAHWVPPSLQPPSPADRPMTNTDRFLAANQPVPLLTAGVVTSTTWSPHLQCRVAQARSTNKSE